jgi:hypothetical protein
MTYTKFPKESSCCSETTLYIPLPQFRYPLVKLYLFSLYPRGLGATIGLNNIFI